jgi:carbon-monoxide dehydrogenase medium subunit
MLANAESHVGNVRVRGQGTLGGNLCFADPHADPPTALLVYDASVTVAGGDGGREMPLGDFLVGTYETALEPDELLTGVRVPALPEGWGSAFLRIERFFRPTANVAVAATLRDGRLGGVRLAVGCVGPKALRLSELEERLVGLGLDDARRTIDDATGYLSERLEPVEDLLGSAEYKLAVTGVLLNRALQQAVAGNGRGQHG